MELSDLLGVGIRVEPSDPGGPLRKTFDIGSIFSKIMALAVYVGSPIQSNLPVLLNQVHADVEWWKTALEADEKPSEPEPSSERADKIQEAA